MTNFGDLPIHVIMWWWWLCCLSPVIDFCLTKNLVCDPSTNYTHLQLEWASHSNCTQRKGLYLWCTCVGMWEGEGGRESVFDDFKGCGHEIQTDAFGLNKILCIHYNHELYWKHKNSMLIWVLPVTDRCICLMHVCMSMPMFVRICER